MTEKVKYGYHYTPDVSTWEEAKAVAQLCEAAGFDIFTATDHYLSSPDPLADVPFGTESHPLDTMLLMTAAAACTRKIELGPTVSSYRLRGTPMTLAKMATTLDIISGGRAICGLGSGWLAVEQELFVGDFPPLPELAKRFDEAMAIVRGMLDNEVFSFKGKYWQFENIRNAPRPVRGTMPLCIGARGEKKVIPDATKYADIINFGFNLEDDVIKRRLAIAKKACEKHGRDWSEITPAIAVWGGCYPSEKEIRWQASFFVSFPPYWNFDKAIDYVKKWPTTPEEHIERFNHWIDMGVRMFTLDFWPQGLYTFKNEIRPKLTTEAPDR